MLPSGCASTGPRCWTTGALLRISVSGAVLLYFVKSCVVGCTAIGRATARQPIAVAGTSRSVRRLRESWRRHWRVSACGVAYTPHRRVEWFFRTPHKRLDAWRYPPARFDRRNSTRSGHSTRRSRQLAPVDLSRVPHKQRAEYRV
jgi:hypothetical protein